MKSEFLPFLGAVGRRVALLLTFGVAAASFPAHAGNITAWEENLYASDDDLSNGDTFGTAMAIDGTTAVIGAPMDGDLASGSYFGSAYLFNKVDSKWKMAAKVRAGDIVAGAKFGSAVAISGDTVAIAAEGIQAVYIFTRSAGVWTQQTKLTGASATLSTVAATAHFGHSVALAGDTLVIGTQDDVLTGAAYVFTRTGSTWAQQAQLAASDGQPVDAFGASVAITGDTVVVGAWKATLPSKSNAGAAYVFTRTSGSWTQEAKLTAGDAAVGDYFGCSVCISGETVLVGASAADGPITSYFYPYPQTTANTGGAYVFTRSAGVWSQQAKLGPTLNQLSGNDVLGWSVSLSGDTAVLGLQLGYYTPTAAWVFVRTGTTWVFSKKIQGNDYLQSSTKSTAAVSGTEMIFANPQTDTAFGAKNLGGTSGWTFENPVDVPRSARAFGSDSAIHGNTAVVGAPYGYNANGVRTGAVYVFTRSGTTWTQQAKLVPADCISGDAFGSLVELEGDTLVASATSSNGNAPRVYVFTRTGTTWTQQARLQPSDTNVGGFASYYFAFAGNTLVVGAPGHPNAKGEDTYRGEAYVFTRTGTSWSETKRLAPPALPDGAFFGSDIAISGNTVAIAASGELFKAHESVSNETGYIYIFQGNGSNWVLKKKLRPPTANLDTVGTSIALSGTTLLVGVNLTIGPPSGGNVENRCFVYSGSGSSWALSSIITPSDAYASASDRLEISGNFAVMGPRKTLYARVGSAWVERIGLGVPIAHISGDTILTSTPGHNNSEGIAEVLRLTSDIAVLDGAAANSPEIISDINVGRLAVGLSLTRTITLRNDGAVPLTGLAVTLDSNSNAADATFTKLRATTLAPNASTSFTVTYKPVAEGDRTTTLNIASSDPDESVVAVSFRSTVTAAPEPPTIMTQPGSVGIDLSNGKPEVTFSVDASGTATLTYQWKKNGTAIKGANGSSYVIPAADARHAGTYTVTVSNKWGSVTSEPAGLSVGTAETESSPLIQVSVVAGKALTLTAPVAGTYGIYWKHRGNTVVNDERVSGADTARLVINQAAPSSGYYGNNGDDGEYTAWLYDSYTGGIRVATFNVTVLQTPVVSGDYRGGSLSWLVSGTPDGNPNFDNNPQRYYATGLPPGVTLHPTGGVLLGSPTTEGFYTVRFWASNAAGNSIPVEVQVAVWPLARDVPGSYLGLVDPNELLNRSLGGRFTLNVTKTGTFSGSLTLGTVAKSFTGRVERSTSGYYNRHAANVPLGRSADGRPLSLIFEIDDLGGFSKGTITAEGESTDTTPVTAYHRGDYTLRPSLAAGTYNCLIPPSGNNYTPRGTGFAFFTVTAAGTGTLAMKLADGSAVTASGVMGADRSYDVLPVHTLLYSNTGSIQGYADVSIDSTEWVGGSLDWFKDPTYTRSGTNFPGGWDAASVALKGSRYHRPAAGTTLLGVDDVADNASISFGSFTSDADPSLIFQLTASGIAKLPLPANNPSGTTFSLNLATGLFTGSYTLVDVDPRDESGVKLIRRKVTYQGLYAQGRTDDGLGYGGGFAMIPPLYVPSGPIIVIGGPVSYESGSVSLTAH